MHTTSTTVDWLLGGDPAIRWQTLRDLVDAPRLRIERERRRVARDGWGARLLAKQDARGTWAQGKSSEDGLYSPKWISTTYTMLLLRDLGLLPSKRHTERACAILLQQGLQRDGGINYGWRGRSETCITGMILSVLACFEQDDDRLDVLARYLLDQQMPDGGWNCRRDLGATHASVHTTINALEGLRDYRRFRRRNIRAIQAAERRGREFLLAHRLFRSHRTGAVIKSDFLRLSFPPRWHYDILRALDYFRSVDAPSDPRLAEAVDVVRSKQQPDGRWRLEHRYRGQTYFDMERVGTPSRWNTLRAMRVMKWWEGNQVLTGATGASGC